MSSHAALAELHSSRDPVRDYATRFQYLSALKITCGHGSCALGLAVVLIAAKAYSAEWSSGTVICHWRIARSSTFEEFAQTGRKTGYSHYEACAEKASLIIWLYVVGLGSRYSIKPQG